MLYDRMPRCLWEITPGVLALFLSGLFPHVIMVLLVEAHAIYHGIDTPYSLALLRGGLPVVTTYLNAVSISVGLGAFAVMYKLGSE